MVRTMIRRQSLMEEHVREAMNDIEPRPLKIEDVKNRAYPKV